MLTLQSPAKVNLFLKVVGKHPDGRPDTVSLCQAVDLCDTLTFQKAARDSLECTDPSIPSNYTSSIFQAVELFRRKTGTHFHVKVTLDKRIPLQAGLCSRSSNAATTLWGLNQLTGSSATMDELKCWSKEILPEAPFFFTSGTTINRSSGAVDSEGVLQPQPLLIASPDEHLPQSAVFNRLRVEELDRRDIEAIVSRAIEGKAEYFNDLEEAAFAIFPKLALIREKLLQSGYHQVRMTGAGPSLVCHGQGTPPRLSQSIRLYKTNPIQRKHQGWF